MNCLYYLVNRIDILCRRTKLKIVINETINQEDDNCKEIPSCKNLFPFPLR
jgi:hypothetical protein